MSSEFSVSGDKLIDVVDLNNFTTVAYIRNATDLDEDISWTQENKNKLKELGFELEEIDLRELGDDELKKKLCFFDAIYFEGGNTFYLLNLAYKSGLTDIIDDLISEKDKLYIGTSAGSIIAAPNIESTKYIDELGVVPELYDYSAFDLVDFVLVPHIGNVDFYQANEEGYNKLFSNLKN